MSLEDCYKSAAKLLLSRPEPFSVVECVEGHRQFWKPPKIHTILLAESHVYTPEEELVEMTTNRFPVLSEAPSKFVRFVYCLGYGEPKLVSRAINGNAGTWQYWKLFAACARDPATEKLPSIQKKHSPELSDRILAKIELLQCLRKLGVWLLDASILALAAPRGTRLHGDAYERLLRCCWESYIGPTIATADPHSIIVIGGSVRSALRDELTSLHSVERHYVNQPQARMSRSEISEMHAIVYRVCQRAARARGA